MAAKYQLITELYRRTGIAVAKNPQAWQSFLAAACRNYKCRFDEQLLIYTVEGNSGDACRQKQYAVGSSVIYGYGIPAY